MTGLTFTERMSGPFAMGAADPAAGARIGARTRWSMTLLARVTVDDVDAFVAHPAASLSGELSVPGVREPIGFEGGTFRLFPPEEHVLMRYDLAVDGWPGEDGPLVLSGRKVGTERPFRVWPETTTLEVRLHRGETAAGEVAGAGVLRIRLTDFGRLLTTVRTPQARGVLDSGRAVSAYLRRLTRGLREAYLPGLGG